MVFSWIEWKKKKYAFNQKEIYLGGGILGFKHTLLPVFKVQNVAIRQNPYQWRRELATVHIHTAAGNLRIPYIQMSEAQNLLDQLIFSAETSGKPWM